MAFTLTVSCLPVHAATPGPSLAQYSHYTWKVADGFANGANIDAAAQAPDGYFLLATELGILRFDGVRTVLWQPPGEPLPRGILDLLFSRDGTLWIATLTGLASWTDGKLTRYSELEGHIVQDLVEDHEGAVWAVGGARDFDILCSFRSRHAQCDGTDGSLRRIFGLVVDSKGNLWAGADDGLWRWRGALEFHGFTPRRFARGTGSILSAKTTPARCWSASAVESGDLSMDEWRCFP
jgi:hypothetical protein